MQADHDKNIHAAALGQRGGQLRVERLNAQDRSALSKHALWARWHRREFLEEQERAREITYTVIQTLKNGRQLPLI
jgi:hypothetical protein